VTLPRRLAQGLTLVYEDSDILVVDKPTGLLSTATGTERDRTAYWILAEYLRKKGEKRRPAVVHRLDRETSGVMIFAKSGAVKKAFMDDWEKRVKSRRYIALAEGEFAGAEGAMAKVSSIHVNVWMGRYDKLSMAERFLSRNFGWQSGTGDRELVFVGDSPNDEPMFARFPLACAVANIRRYSGLITHEPAFAASRECGEGFAEIARVILERRR
jgi:3-deoxy-D-manno-octulosonate 8-phosphate phosphatase KdsC-like HAD superfamily phosphatase